jgi:uncharacterized protein YkwD
MNPIDALLALILLLSVWSGWTRGFVLTLLQLLALAASLVLAFVGYPHGAAMLESMAPALGVWTLPLSFLGTYVLAHLVLSALTSAVIRAVPRAAHQHGANRALGLLPGFAGGLVNTAVLSIVLLTVPILDGLSELARESAMASRLSAPADWLEARLSPIFDSAIHRTLKLLIVPPESRVSIDLSFRTAGAKVRPDLEARMLDMVNAERARRGVQALKPDPELAEVARAHSRDMLARGYFSHIAPDGQDPFERMRKANVRYLMAGENLAFAPTLPAAHQGLMNSPGHRANMLRPQFGRLGVGVVDAGRYGLMVTQNFRN